MKKIIPNFSFSFNVNFYSKVNKLFEHTWSKCWLTITILNNIKRTRMWIFCVGLRNNLKLFLSVVLLRTSGSIAIKYLCPKIIFDMKSNKNMQCKYSHYYELRLNGLKKIVIIILHHIFLFACVSIFFVKGFDYAQCKIEYLNALKEVYIR